jgi:hypothetical protein
LTMFHKKYSKNTNSNLKRKIDFCWREIEM